MIEKITELSKEMNDLKKDSEALTRTQNAFVPTRTFESFKIDLHNVVNKFWALELRDISRNLYLNYWYQYIYIYSITLLFYSDLFNIFI